MYDVWRETDVLQQNCISNSVHFQHYLSDKDRALWMTFINPETIRTRATLEICSPFGSLIFRYENSRYVTLPKNRWRVHVPRIFQEDHGNALNEFARKSPREWCQFNTRTFIDACSHSNSKPATTSRTSSILTTATKLRVAV